MSFSLSRLMRGSAVVIFYFCLAIPAQAALQVTNIRQVDFENFSYPWRADEGDRVPIMWEWIDAPNTMVSLVRREHQFRDPHAPDDALPPYLVLNVVMYGDLDGDGREEAIVMLMYATGGTATWAYLYIYTLRDQKPVPLGWLRTGSRGSGALFRMQLSQPTLILDFADPDRQVADCCSDGVIRVTYRLENGKFVESAPREKLDTPTYTGAPIK